jgi:hypothetical protein
MLQSLYMKMRDFFLALVILLSASAVRLEAASINQTIASINADAQKPGGPERVSKSISASMHIPVAALANEKASTGLSYGDLYIAHAIACAAGKSSDQIVRLKMHGQTWDKIADDNNVSLGSQKVKKNVANAKPTPVPRTTPQMPRQPDTSNTYKTMP